MIIVATGGCFDILHAGHVSLFKDIHEQCSREAASLRETLYFELYLNSDSSISRIKGPGRPINKLQDRVTVLHGIKYIDSVFVFDEDTPCGIIAKKRPDIWVKGGDYKKEDLPETSIVESYGGKVIIIPKRYDVSTTTIIEKIKAL